MAKCKLLFFDSLNVLFFHFSICLICGDLNVCGCVWRQDTKTDAADNKYDRNKSFFDGLATETKKSKPRTDLQTQKEVDTSTFGSVAATYKSRHINRNQRRQGGYGGQRGSYYQNGQGRRYESRQQGGGGGQRSYNSYNRQQGQQGGGGQRRYQQQQQQQGGGGGGGDGYRSNRWVAKR